MNVGFIGFGEVASTLAEGLKVEGLEVYTCLAGRSPRTVSRANSVGVGICNTPQNLAKKSDILISAVMPKQAVNVAREVKNHVKGVYVDINNVSPSTVQEALAQISGKTVDAAIIGSIKKGLKTKIIASGHYAKYFSVLNEYGMNIDVIGDEIGQASAVKMFRSAYTKGVSALLFECLKTAYLLGLDEMVIHYLSETEGSQFRGSTISRITSSVFHAKRRAQEMEEVTEFLADYTDPLMNKATLEFFHTLYQKMGNLKERPEWDEVFRTVDEKY